ncbi:MAG: MotA/TolQ/ExbB proton channel family protein [Paracoccaceae bacterium]
MGFSLSSIGSGGPIIAVLSLLSLVSLALIVVKVVQLWSVRSGVADRQAALEAWAQGDKHVAAESIAHDKSPADRIMSYAISALRDGFSGPRLEAELMRRGNDEVMEMSKGIRLLELIAMISPLLGLLGTVLGMIQSFQELEMAEGAANASVLAGGIWQALLTTAAGLLVAIPAAVGAGLLSARIDAAAQLIENAVGELLLINEKRS